MQKIGHLEHLQHLHLSELFRREVAEPSDRAFARKTSGHGPPFSCLMGLRSLKLDLHESSSAVPDGDGTRSFLQPISCMNNLQGFALLGLSNTIGLQQLTSLGVDHVEDDLSTLVKLKHLQAATISPHTLWRPLVSLSASLVTLTNLRSLDCIHIQHYQVSNLTVLTALSTLTLRLMDDTPFDYQSCMAVWSELAKLPHLHTLSVCGRAVLNVKDVQPIAVLSSLTKLHFEGSTTDLNVRAEDVNKLSALASLQSLSLEFIRSARSRDAMDNPPEDIAEQCKNEAFSGHQP